MKFYRYHYSLVGSLDEFGDCAGSRTEVYVHEYDLISETPKGYWIGTPWDKKWVSKTARKRFAYPTKSDALEAFIKRTERYIQILTERAKTAQMALHRAEVIRMTMAVEGARNGAQTGAAGTEADISKAHG